MNTVDLSAYAQLKVWAEMFADAQEQRIRWENRLRRAPVFSDAFAPALAAAVETEHRIHLAMRRQFRHTVPLGVKAWLNDTKGIGIGLLARLVGHLGHPRIATPFHWEGSGAERKLVADEPYLRTVGQLWQYCGHGRPGRPAKGMTAPELAALGDPVCKMLAHLLAECAIRQPGRHLPDAPSDLARPIANPACRDLLAGGQKVADPHLPSAPGDPSATSPRQRTEPIPRAAVWPYRAVYEARRLVTAERLHGDPCVRCGPSGHPAEIGTPWSPGHQHADALRVTAKAILRDLWIASGDDQ